MEYNALFQRIHKPQGIVDSFWAFVSLFGLLLLGGGIASVLQGGLNEVNSVAIGVGGILVYRWHKTDEAAKADRQFLKQISEEIEFLKRNNRD